MINTIDIIGLSWNSQNEKLYVYLPKRDKQPFENYRAFLGGFIRENEDSDLNDTIKRVFLTKQKDYSYDMEDLCENNIEHIYTIGNNTRDIRGWSISNVYMVVLDYKESQDWMEIDEVDNWDLAFDHNEIFLRVRKKLKETKNMLLSLCYKLLPKTFTLVELQKCYETLLQQEIAKKTFRRHLEDENLKETGEYYKKSHGRPAMLYFNPLKQK